MVVGLAVFSSTLSGFGFVGGPGLVYNMGMSSVWMVIVSTLGYAICFYMLAKRIRVMADVRDTISLPDIVASRYSSKAAGGWMAVVVILGVLGYLATQILAMSTVLQSILGNTAWFEGISLITCAIVSTSVLIFYAVTGGILASVYTDLVQGAIMMVCGLLVVIAAAAAVDGGFSAASTTLLADDPEAIMPFGSLGMFGAVGWFFMFGVGLAGQPHLITKLMMNRKIRDNRIILPLSIAGYAVAAMLWISVGLVMRALVLQGDHAPLLSPDDAAPEFLATYANPLLAGVVFAGLFAAIMSTADGFLNIGAAAVIHDLPKAITGKALKNELLWARIATVLLTVFATVFALYAKYNSGELVALLGAFGWGTFAAAIFPVVAIGLNWKRANATAAISAIILSLVFNFSIKLFGIAMPFGMDGGFVSMLISCLAFIAVSYAMKPVALPQDIERAMDI
jgi:SSS family transporter